MEMKQKKYFILSFGIIILITILAFSNSINNDFTNWDDSDYVTANDLIRDFSPSGIWTMFTSIYAGNYHPLTALTNAIEFKIFGLNPHAFHFLNLLFHLCNVALVFYFIFLLSGRIEVAAITAVFFAIHPMHVESVSWVSERKDVLYTFFYLNALIAYIRLIISRSLPIKIGTSMERGKKSFFKGEVFRMWFPFFLFLLSCLSKSAAVTFPVLMLLLDYYLNRKFTKASLLEKIPFFVLSLIFGFIAIYSQRSTGTMELAPHHTLSDKIFIPVYNICLYIFKMFVPINLCSIYSYPEKAGGLLPMKYYFSLLLFALMVFGIYKSHKYNKDYIFGGLFFLITIALMLQVIPVGSAIIAERYTYVSYVGLFFIIGSLYVRIADYSIKGSEQHSNFIKKLKITFTVFLLGSVIVLSILTFNRNKVWKNSITLFSDVVIKNPNEFISYFGRGIAKVYMKDYLGGIEDLDLSISMYPFPASYYERANAKEKLNRYEEAINDYIQAIRINPDYADAFYNLGNLRLNKMEDYEGAVYDFSNAIRVKPDYSLAWNDRAVAREKMNDTVGALSDYSEAIRISPKYSEAYFNRASLKMNRKDFSGAIMDLDKVIRLNESDGEAYFSRGAAKVNLGLINEGCMDFRKADELNYLGAKDFMIKYCQ